MWCCGSCGSECVTGKFIVSKPTSKQQFHTHKQFEAQQPAHSRVAGSCFYPPDSRQGRGMSAAGEKAGGGGRNGRKGGGRGGRSGSSAEQGAEVQEQMQTLTLNGGEAATARSSEAAATRTIDGVEILEAEPHAEAAPASADDPPSSTPSAASPAVSQRESAEPEPSVQTRLGWALNRRGLMWVLIAGRSAANTDRTEEEVWCRVRGHEPGSDELSVEVLTDCTVLPWRTGHALVVGLTSVREVLTRIDWLGFAEEMQTQHQQQYHHHSRDPMR